MVGEVVVVLDGLEGGGFAEEAEVVDGGWGGEESLERWWGWLVLGLKDVGYTG